MKRFAKYALMLALMLFAIESLVPNEAHARSRWLAANGYGMGVFPGAAPRFSPLPFTNFPFNYGPAVNMQQNPVFFMGPMLRGGRGLPSPNPFYHYNVPYAGYYWRPY